MPCEKPDITLPMCLLKHRTGVKEGAQLTLAFLNIAKQELFSFKIAAGESPIAIIMHLYGLSHRTCDHATTHLLRQKNKRPHASRAQAGLLPLH